MALSAADRKQGRYERIDRLSLLEKQAVRGWLKGYGKEVLLVRQIFTNKDGSTGILNLVCSDLTLDGEQVTRIYQKKIATDYESSRTTINPALCPTLTPGLGNTTNSTLSPTRYCASPSCAITVPGSIAVKFCVLRSNAILNSA